MKIRKRTRQVLNFLISIQYPLLALSFISFSISQAITLIIRSSFRPLPNLPLSWSNLTNFFFIVFMTSFTLVVLLGFVEGYILKEEADTVK